MKKIVKKVGLFLLVFFFAIKISAQSPGYMGKRVSMGYGLYVNPAFNSLIADYSDSPINSLHEFFLEIATSKKFTLGISAQLYRYIYNNTQTLEGIGSGYSYSSLSNISPEGSYEIKGRNYKLYGKFYRKNYLAPWGKYFLLGVVLSKYNTSYDPNTMYVYMQERVSSTVTKKTIYNDWGPTSDSFRTMDIFFGNGNSRILSDKIVVDYGYSIGVIAMAKILLDFENGFGSPNSDEYISKTSSKRVAGVNRFNFYLKIGYLF